ncbi:MAG: pyridoxamine 5'-phosphate oxidase [Robiginitomaculum sp.]
MKKTDIPHSPSAKDYSENADYARRVKATAKPIFDARNPYELFSSWLSEARVKELNDANAMALASVDETGLPDVRMVLLKGVDGRGFVFYSHAKSAKGVQLASNAKAALNFHWKSLRRQVRIRGEVERVTKAEVSAYFKTRARASRIGAWASKQSSPMENRAEFERALDKIKAKFKGAGVPLPPGWCGWRVQPLQIEFWRERPFRLHERLLFSKNDVTDDWTKSRLYP